MPTFASSWSQRGIKGPTKSGLALPGVVLMGIIESLEKLRNETPGNAAVEFSRVSKRGEAEIVISVVPPDDLKSLPSVDVREYISTPNYKGPTKKGIRFSWDKLSKVIGLLKTQSQQMGNDETNQRTLFPEAKPMWVERAEEVSKSDDHGQAVGRDPILASVLPDGPKLFPAEFLTDTSGDMVEVNLPQESLEVGQHADGAYFVRSEFGFSWPVRNPTEGKYICYAHLRGQRCVRVPNPMITIFKTVKAYQNYLRDLRYALHQAYERKSGYRPVAEHRTKEVFQNLGLPWLES